MKIKTILITFAVALTAIIAYAQEPAGSPPEGGGPGGGPHHGGIHLLPPHAAEQLNLTDDQKKQLAALEAEVKTKIEAILTPAQLEQLKQMRPPHPGGPGGGPNAGKGDKPPGGNQ